VRATDLRAGAALVIAGTMADGVTEIIGIEHIERGYSKIVEKLQGLGVKIWREALAESEQEELRIAD
jgi:UDP-N-acetylglucosamine 1-carboxyvinyltransferase